MGRRAGRRRREGELRGKGRGRREGRKEGRREGKREGKRERGERHRDREKEERERSYFPVQLSMIPTTGHPRFFTPCSVFFAAYFPRWSTPQVLLPL